jgi:tRNA modification GTPase
MLSAADCTGAAATIFALSSAPGKAGVAVIRVSGPRAGATLTSMAGSLPPPRSARFAALRNPATGELLDRALVLWMPGPRSFTGEDIAEFHTHGGRATVAAVLGALGRETGLRPAEAGEFARRAFVRGRLDLAEAEALADLIDAETAAQRRFALRGLEGGIGAQAEAWRSRALDALALAEAAIDFVDEGDVPDGLMARAGEAGAALAANIAAALDDGGRGERLRSGAVIVVAGPPNVGKSTLLNHLAGRDAAIVSPHAGTTRDAVEVHLDLGGYPATVVDTAGQRPAADPVEEEGVRRARARAAAADLVLWLDDDPSFPGCPVAGPAPLWRVRTKVDLVAQGALSFETAVARTPSMARTLPKVPSYPRLAPASASVGNAEKPVDGRVKPGYDGREVAPRPWIASSASHSRNDDRGGPHFAISVTRGDGLDTLTDALAAWLRDGFESGPEPLIARARHRAACEDALAALHRLDGAGAPELAAEELRLAARSLGRIAGRVDVEDVLDRIFASFCIGK